ncbi:hypothetical protein [Anatilimnocola floriformis]|uniref:hypothetical protein n=1 Tax=Anatilimnocola floriformis TaxID=2948575 RepID=UPI0020C59EFE|nr:hypothetical protein [Anatilimnocola floriformis]
MIKNRRNAQLRKTAYRDRLARKFSEPSAVTEHEYLEYLYTLPANESVAVREAGGLWGCFFFVLWNSMCGKLTAVVRREIFSRLVTANERNRRSLLSTVGELRTVMNEVAGVERGS